MIEECPHHSREFVSQFPEGSIANSAKELSGFWLFVRRNG